LLPYILFEKYTYILALGMAGQWKQHCANCIGTLSFPIGAMVQATQAGCELKVTRRGQHRLEFNVYG